jgi:hypothetical protein
MPLIVNVVVTLAIQQHMEYNFKACIFRMVISDGCDGMGL